MINRSREMASPSEPQSRQARAVFLDRDGVVNEEVNYLRHADDFRLLPRSARAIRELRRAGFKVIVVTNQSGLARGYFSPEDLVAVHERMRSELARARTGLDGIYICPHHPDESCLCRKPGVLLFQQAAQELGLSLVGSYFVGDKLTDLTPGKALGGRTVLVLTGYGQREVEVAREQGFAPDHVAADLYAAAKWIIDEDSAGL
ncbi:MAG: D-glycero-beta-D-manno-heptose-1,7-bisphosphate 7-phosphatase [Chloroflexi bacterium ADurb.Bin180]|nr:MAG: D-glycero-beta-D-manno-heptose-1,7-bisphosphate 7-phosphatase [Chloroflexi bacterium ADurb.Bin180]